MTTRDQANLISAYKSGASKPPPLHTLASRRKKTFDSRESARDRLGNKMPFVSFDPRVFDAYISFGLRVVDSTSGGQEVELSCNPIVEEAIYRAMDPPPTLTSSSLRSISCPVTICTGDQETGPHSRLIAANRSLYMSSSINRKLVSFKGLSHFGPFEKPEMVAEAIEESILCWQRENIRSRL